MSITKICPTCQKEFSRNPLTNRAITCSKECGYKLRATRHLLPVKVRFWSKVNKTESCWLWTGSKHSSGYGYISIDGKLTLTHRVSYELLVGLIPEGLVLDHSCHVRNCVNPSHLEPVTIEENSRRQLPHLRPKTYKKRDSCRRGHVFSTENSYIRPDGKRDCKLCKRVNRLK